MPVASIGYQKYLLSLKVMTSQLNKDHDPLRAVLGGTGDNGFNNMYLLAEWDGRTGHMIMLKMFPLIGYLIAAGSFF